MRKTLIVAFAFIFCLSTSFAQRKKWKMPKVVKAVVTEKTPQEKLYEELLPSTAKVMFIDSVVVSKDSFLLHIPLTTDMGHIAVTKANTIFTNEFNDTRILAQGDSIKRHLYISHRYGKKWDAPSELKELSQQNIDYPFLMTDGVTLYYSAEGDGTVGGRDVFRTTYNAEEDHFYDAANMGMPFNSPANEYLLVISDLDNLGWLVSDRYQPAGKVCIYVFEPTAQRQIFDENTDEEAIKRYAGIKIIKDSWQFGNRDAAMKRREEMLARMNSKQTKDRIEFIVNDKTIYTSLSDFKSSNGKRKYQEIAANKRKLSQLQSLLDTTRDQYAIAAKKTKYNIGRQIDSLEKEVSMLEITIDAEEKALRNAENK